MSNEIISVKNNRVVFGETISRVAETLSPLGAAAKVVAELSACVSEMGRLKVEGKRIAADNGAQLAVIDARKAAVRETFRSLRDSSELNGVTAQGLLQAMSQAQRDLVRAATSDEQQRHQDLVKMLGNMLVTLNTEGRARLSIDIDNTLNGAGAPVWAAGNSTSSAKQKNGRSQGGSGKNSGKNGGGGKSSGTTGTRRKNSGNNGTRG